MSECRGSECLTNGVRVRARPFFIPEQSSPEAGEFIFGYRIIVINESDKPARLVSRRWVILDADGDRREVEGEGVVGQQPTIGPGESFEYASFCSLRTPWGTMEGEYRMEVVTSPAHDDPAKFEVRIDRFYLVAPPNFANADASRA